MPIAKSKTDKVYFKLEPMHLFGITAFVLMMLFSLIGIFRHPIGLTKYIPYGLIIFAINLIYIKLIVTTRQDYEEKINAEKNYSQELLRKQKIFLRHAVHETSTPLAVIMANIELYELENSRHPTLSNIEAATKNLYSIYDDLSYLAKNDHVSYPKTYIDLTAFVLTRVEFFSVVAIQSELSLNFHSNAKDAWVLFNETKLQRIIDNTITNALKYTIESNIIDISVAQKDKLYLLEISSHSTPIEDVVKIFEPHYREAHNKEGLGLGLSLVKRICDEEGIMIDISSDTNKTTFTYHF